MVSKRAPGLKQGTTTAISVAIQKRQLQRTSFSLAQLHCGSLPRANHYNESKKKKRKKKALCNRQVNRLTLRATVQTVAYWSRDVTMIKNRGVNRRSGFSGTMLAVIKAYCVLSMIIMQDKYNVLDVLV